MLIVIQHYDFSHYPIVFDTLAIVPNSTTAEEAFLIGSLGGRKQGVRYRDDIY